MSINSAMLAGVSGLVSNSSALAAISDNIANVNTVAYKRRQVDFANVVTSQAAKGNYSAGGVQGVSRAFVSQQGIVQAANSTTSLAISGDGFFIAATRPGDLSAADARVFTRAGAFSVDSSGYLVNTSGLYLQGWPINEDGSFDVNPSDLTRMASINVKNLGASVSATTEIGIGANVNKDQALNTLAVVGDPAATPAVLPTYAGATPGSSMADYAADNTTGTKPDFVMEMNVVDSQGGAHKFAMAFLKDPAANTWNTEIYAVPAGDVTVDTATPSTVPPGQIAQGKVVFKQDGTIDLANTTLFGAAGAEPQLMLNASGGATPRWSDSLGLAAQTVALDMSKFTQYAETSSVKALSSNGAGVGNVVGVQVGDDGVVSAIYDNSQIRKIAKIGLATFSNPDGLTAVNGSAYQASLAAGDLIIKEAGVGGAGEISPSSLEASTVDLSAEFTGLISTQKAYSASSKIITTADQMLDQLINIIR